MSHSPRVAVIGSANVDLVTFGDAVPQSGETVFGRRFVLGFGGKGANQAVAARAMGAEVLMIGKLGRDVFGDAIIRNLASLGIDAAHVQLVDGATTGVASIFVEPSGQNRIVVTRGANDLLAPEDVDAAAEDLRRVDVVMVQFEVPLETVYHAVSFARRHNIRCIVNPAPAVAVDMARLTPAEYFIPNESEAERLVGLPVRSSAQAEACAAALLAKGFRHVLITRGAQGSLLADRHGSVHIPAFPVATVDTTGAGDAFIGSLAVLLAEGLTLRDCAARASLYAALSTATPGAQASFPVRSRFDEEWERRRASGTTSRSPT